MGELFRKAQQANRNGSGPESATPAQRDYLRRLCLEQDGDVDEEWLAGLSTVEASREIGRRVEGG